MKNHASKLAEHWLLDPEVIFLNHGSFGACPAFVLEQQTKLRTLLETKPMEFLERKYMERLDQARAVLAKFAKALEDEIAFVPNATTGVNSVLRSLHFKPGDRILLTDHEYHACKNAVRFITDRYEVKADIVTLPFPVADEEEIIEAILAHVHPDTRLALIDWITSPTALVLPIKRFVSELQSRGVDVLVDGAHAPGMVDLNLSSLGAAYFTGNCHKWLCAPKGAAFLYVRKDRQQNLHPLTISHGYKATGHPKSAFQLEFDWTGTADPTPYLCIPEAIEFMASLVPGGWKKIRQQNHELALKARDILCDALKIKPPCPDSMIGSTAAFPLPGKYQFIPDRLDPLQQALLDDYRIEIPVMPGPPAAPRLLRISAQLYNTKKQYEVLAEAVKDLLPKETA